MFATSRISAVILVSRVNSANQDISRNFCLAIWIFFRFQIVGLPCPRYYYDISQTYRGHVTPNTSLSGVINLSWLRYSTNTLRASSNGNLFLPRTERRFGDRAFSVAAPRVWNRLPTELKLMRRSSTTTFKRHLQAFLFNPEHSSHWLQNHAPSD